MSKKNNLYNKDTGIISFSKPIKMPDEQKFHSIHNNEKEETIEKLNEAIDLLYRQFHIPEKIIYEFVDKAIEASDTKQQEEIIKQIEDEQRE